MMLSNDRLIKCTFNLSTILYVKKSIGHFVNNICLYSKESDKNKNLTITVLLYLLKLLFNQTNVSLFYIVFDHYWFLELYIKRYKILLFLRLFIHQVLFFYVLTFLDLKYTSNYSFKNCFADCWLVCIIFIGSTFIDPESCPQVCLQIVSGMYSNQIYRFATLFRLVVGRGEGDGFLLHLSLSIHWLDPRKFLKLFIFKFL